MDEVAFWTMDAARLGRARLLGRAPLGLARALGSDMERDCFFILRGGKSGSGEFYALCGLPSFPVACGTVARGG